ncbi:MAG: Flp pilus assembly complex ATPase component TadA [Nitrospirae bacterium]|nr:Flp pilus assembly complex ATPase component TadA [Nitrospirota bacterium]MBI5695591.1 Flp pilus assembly complex ATPase component TadA [Nitrospirota bacterium]
MIKQKIGDLLIREGLLTESQLSEALILQKAKKKRLGKILKELGIVTEQEVAYALSHQLGLPSIALRDITPDSDLLSIITQDDAERYMALPVSVQDKTLTLAMSDPLDHNAIEELRFKTGFVITPVIATESDIVTGIEKFYQVEEKVYDLMRTVKAYDDAEFLKERIEDKVVNIQSLYKMSEAPPIIKLVTMIIVEAVRMRASDIHIEPRDELVMVRYRIDGDLKDVLKLPKRVQDSVASRIKIISDMDITKRRLPQDGTSKLRLPDREVDLRISTLPSLHGEKIVIRLLDKSKGLVTLSHVGLTDGIEAPLLKIISQPQGFVLVTGPTGSGKSTTLYAILQQLKSEIENVITVEDPIEYRLDGITQVGVNEAINLTFPAVLRSILRQDPDIIMVGEIRDFDTADIAVKSALTGHLVLSTLHTNDTISTITRLIDLGVPPFLVSSSLNCVLAQRLVKRICRNCIQDNTEEDSLTLSDAGLPVLPVSYKGAGCDKCSSSGYHGQVGVFELLAVTPRMRRMIARGASEDELWDEAMANGARTLFEDAMAKVVEGITTVDEVMVKVPNIRKQMTS